MSIILHDHVNSFQKSFEMENVKACDVRGFDGIPKPLASIESATHREEHHRP
jgi:hypothetical protein